jgi:hypothetical protein
MERTGSVPIHTYTRQNAIDDGVLLHVADLTGKDPIGVCFTARLFDAYQEPSQRERLVRDGLRLLSRHEQEDGHRRLRVVEERVWAIWDAEGITFMRPEDS